MVTNLEGWKEIERGHVSVRRAHWSGITLGEHARGCLLVRAMRFRSQISERSYCLVNNPAATSSTANPALTVSATELPTPV